MNGGKYVVFDLFALPKAFALVDPPNTKILEKGMCVFNLQVWCRPGITVHLQ